MFLRTACENTHSDKPTNIQNSTRQGRREVVKSIIEFDLFPFFLFSFKPFLRKTLPAHQGKPTTAQSLPIHHPPPGLGWDRVLARTRQAWEKEALMPEAPEVVATVLQRLCNPMGYSPPGFSVNGILHFLLQGIFLTQESNLSLLCLLH